MQIPVKPNQESDSIKKAFIATSIALYMQSCHLQYEEEADAVMLSFLLANAPIGQSGKNEQGGSGRKGMGSAGNTGKGNDEDDDDLDERNLGSSTVNNTGHITTETDFIGAGHTGVPRETEDTQKSETEPPASTSPGGANDSRIIGGVNPEDDEIDWNDVVDDGSKDADAATG